MSEKLLSKTANEWNRFNLKMLGGILLGWILAFSVWGCATRPPNTDRLFQASTIDALLVGVYDGETTFRELKRHGDFGLGTFNGLDGEMIALDGKYYQVKVDGAAYPVEDTMKTPFAVVTFFESDQQARLNGEISFEQLEQCIDSLIPTKNIFYAVKIEGHFDYVKTRSVPGQHEPYPPLVDVVKHQAIFEFHDVRGTIVGFRSPAYVKGINVPGYHLHFLTHDKKAGGHLLECRSQNVQIEIDYNSEFTMVLPRAGGFDAANLTTERHEELKRVER